VGLALATLSVYYTWSVSAEMKHEDEISIDQLRADERNAVEMWVDIVSSTDVRNINNRELLNNLAKHTNVPIIITDNVMGVVISNLPPSIVADDASLEQMLAEMQNNAPISVEVEQGFGRKHTYTIYYNTTDYSSMVANAHSDALALFPYVQLVIIIVFAIFAYIAFLSTKQNEQNRVWVGLAKETAHQLGTPTSSLLGWVEYLRSQPVDQMAVDEMSKDWPT
jgi:hypothetical protein